MPEDMNTAKIRRHAEDISNTINNINLNIALDSETQINIEKVMIIAFIRKIVTEYANRNPEYDFEFDYNFKENELFRMDMHLIKRAIENILINAIEHNLPCKIMISLNKTEDFLIIEISDDGGEVEQEIIHKLNTKFDLNYDNIGLGTNVVKQIIKIHSGSVKFLSEGGLKVQIKLPQKKS